MSNLTKGLILVGVILAIGAGLVVWKKKVGGQGSESFNQITKHELEMLLADVAKTNPLVLKRLKEDPEMKKQQIENLKQLLAFASQSQREGLAADPTNRQELDNIRAESQAGNYDREINKDKGPMPPFGFITEDMIKAYWAEDSQPPAGKGWLSGLMENIGLGGKTEHRSHEEEFNQFLDSKIALMRAGNPDMKDKEISDEERTQARDIFAKIRMYRNQFEQKSKAGELSADFIEKVNLQVKLQQAQFLARLYSEKIAEKAKVTDEEIATYISEHPELDPKEKRAKAQEILDRAKAGEDFAALANEFTQDPGNKGADGVAQGGLYKDVPKGRMVAPFEAAALAIEQGQVSPELVETDFGFHIIKLERRLGPSESKDQTTASGTGTSTGDSYDVRHILITTGYKDPDNPTARETPVKEYVHKKLETEKEKQILDEIVAGNNVQVPDDFTIPEVTDEQIQQMRQKQQIQQGMPPEAELDEPGPKPGKPAVKTPPAKKK